MFFLCLFFLMIRLPPRSTRTDTLLPYTTLFRSLLAGGCDAGGKPGGVPADPPAHHRAAGGGGDLQFDLGREGSDPEPAYRLYPRDRGPCGRDHPSAPDRRAGRSLSGAIGRASCRERVCQYV